MISIGPEGTTIWALQLNIDQSGNSFNSHLEKQFILVLPSQPNPPKPMKIVRGNPKLKRLLLVCCKKNQVLPIDRGDLCRGKNNMSKITTAQGNLKERRHSTQCKKTIISKVVIQWTSLTLQRTIRMLTSVSLAFLKKR